jgi:hypothetical protein
MATSLREWLARHPPPDSRFRQSLAGVAERVRAGEDLRFAVRELLDEVLDVAGLRCLAASPRMLVALKVPAHRVGEDESDVRFLAAALALRTSGEVPAVAEDVFGDRLEPAARFFVEELFR